MRVGAAVDASRDPLLLEEAPDAQTHLLARRGHADHDGQTARAKHRPGGLDGLGGGESPARSALLLVLDGGELALVVPVEGSGGGGELVLLRELDNGELGGTDVGVNSEEELELVLGVVGELGDAVDLILSSGGEGSVGLSDLLDGLLEDGEAVGLLLGGPLDSVLGKVGIVPLLRWKKGGEMGGECGVSGASPTWGKIWKGWEDRKGPRQEFRGSCGLVMEGEGAQGGGRWPERAKTQ